MQLIGKVGIGERGLELWFEWWEGDGDAQRALPTYLQYTHAAELLESATTPFKDLILKKQHLQDLRSRIVAVVAIEGSGCVYSFPILLCDIHQLEVLTFDFRVVERRRGYLVG